MKVEVEIEITPEMIEAGCRELSRYCPSRGNEKEVVTAIFAGMLNARCDAYEMAIKKLHSGPPIKWIYPDGAQPKNFNIYELYALKEDL